MSEELDNTRERGTTLGPTESVRAPALFQPADNSPGESRDTKPIGERFLHSVLLDLLIRSDQDTTSHLSLFQVREEMRRAIVGYADLVQTVRHPVRWNVDCVDASVCYDHKVVVPINSTVILMGAKTLERDGKEYDTSKVGVITNERGAFFVFPGDWLVERLPDLIEVYTDAEYTKLFL